VTVSLSDGAPARILALFSGLRQFHPDYLHVWSPKTFFHFGSLDRKDIEHHSFDTVVAVPPIRCVGCVGQQLI
jgi:hypothetical protein